MNDESITKNLMQLEELYGYKFGVVYQSNFNTLIVDPIKSSNSEAPEKVLSLRTNCFTKRKKRGCYDAEIQK